MFIEEMLYKIDQALEYYEQNKIKILAKKERFPIKTDKDAKSWREFAERVSVLLIAYYKAQEAGDEDAIRSIGAKFVTLERRVKKSDYWKIHNLKIEKRPQVSAVLNLSKKAQKTVQILNERLAS